LTLSTPFTAVVGAANVVVGDFQVRTTNAGAVSVQSLDIDGSTNFNSTFVSQVKLWRQIGTGGSRQEIDAEGGFDISAGGTVTFDNFDEIIVPSSSTQTFRVTIDLVNSSVNSGTIAALGVSAITLQDDDNNSITSSTTLPVSLIRAVSVTAAGSLTVNVDNTDTNTNQSKSVVAGNTSDYVASYEFVANNEDILIENLTLVGSGPSTQLSSIVKSVQVYEMTSNGATLLAEEEVLNGQSSVQFNDLNKVIAQGTKNLYFKVITQRYGQNYPGIDYTTGIQFYLTMATTDGQGVASNQDLSGAFSTAVSLPFYVFPIRISNVAFVTSFDGTTVNTTTSPGSGINLAIVRVTTDNWSNTDSTDGSLLNLLLNAITVKNSSSYVSNLNIRRLDISSPTVISATGTSFAVFNLSASGSTSDREVSPSDTAYFLVRGDIGGLAASSSTTVRLDLENLDAGAFSFTHDGTGAGTYTALRLGISRMDGTSIQVNN